MKTAFGFFADARADLAVVTNAIYADMRERLERSLVDHETAATNTVLCPPTPPPLINNAFSIYDIRFASRRVFQK